MPFGWSQLRRAAYLFNQSTAARVRALPQEKSPGNRTPLKHVRPTSRADSAPTVHFEVSCSEPESWSHAMKVDGVINASQVLSSKDSKVIFTPLTGLGHPQTAGRKNTSHGWVGKVSQGAVYFAWARDNMIVVRILDLCQQIFDSYKNKNKNPTLKNHVIWHLPFTGRLADWIARIQASKVILSFQAR